MSRWGGQKSGAEMKTCSHPEVTTMRTTKSSVRSSSSSDNINPGNITPEAASPIAKGIPDVKGIPGASALKGISNKALLSGIRRLSETERETVLSILVHLIEIDRRGLYLPLGFSSLYEFCRDHLGYSEGTAVRRVNLARCIRDFPQSYLLLASGRISMSNLVKISKVIDDVNADALLSEIEGRSAREVDLIASRHRPKSAIRDRVTPVYVKTVLEVRGDDSSPGNRFKQNTLPAGGRFSTINVDGKYPDTSVDSGDGCSNSGNGDGNGNGSGKGPAATSTGSGPLASVIVLEQRFEVKFGVGPEFLKKVRRIRSLLSSKHHRHLEFEELFSILMDEYIERHSPEGRIRRKSGRKQRKAENGTSNGKKKEVPEVSRYIPLKVRDEVYARDHGRCAYVSAEGRRCGSTHDLQIDHIVPFARGGDSSPGNLRLLCGKHNRLEAERVYGKKHMEKYVKEPTVQYIRVPVGWYLNEPMEQYAMAPAEWYLKEPKPRHVKEPADHYNVNAATITKKYIRFPEKYTNSHWSYCWDIGCIPGTVGAIPVLCGVC
jgi:5-methylcytosine-specific restriction endonuclease McrA